MSNTNLPLPEDVLPECWKNATKINALYAPIRSQYVNSEDRDLKLSFWKKMIELYCTYNAEYSFTITSLRKAFYYGGKSPSCLNELINNLLEHGILQTRNKFLEKSADSWTGWMTDVLIKKPLMWSYNKVKQPFVSKEEDEYVHLTVLKLEGKKLLSNLPDNYKDKLVSLNDLVEILKIKFPSLTLGNARLLMHYLVCEGKASVKEETFGQNQVLCLVKISDTNIKPISEAEVSIYNLEKNEKILLKNIEHLEDSIKQCELDAKAKLLKGHRQLAKTFLKKKHELMKGLERKTNALHNIQIMLERLKDTETDAHIFESYKHTLAAFNKRFKETGLDEDSVSDTMIQISEMLEIHDDIQSTLSKSLKEDDVDLEEELNELIEEDKVNKNGSIDTDVNEVEESLKRLRLNFPDVPDKNPSLSQQEVSFN